MYVIFSGVAEAVKQVENSVISLRLVLEGDSFLCESLLCKVIALQRLVKNFWDSNKPFSIRNIFVLVPDYEACSANF